MIQTPETAKKNLLSVLDKGRIMLNGLPLTGEELRGLQSDTLMLYGAAKENEETKAPAITDKIPSAGAS